MISGTDFTIEKPEFVVHACRGLKKRVTTPSEVENLVRQCEEGRAMCLSSSDGMLVVDLRPGPEGLELFVWLAVGFRHGAYDRQDAALDPIGRDLDASTIAFQSRRRGWGRRLSPEWHRRGSDEFFRHVDR